MAMAIRSHFDYPVNEDVRTITQRIIVGMLYRIVKILKKSIIYLKGEYCI